VAGLTGTPSIFSARAFMPLLLLRIPTKPAMHSNLKPATYTDLKPATVPI
jgi:hypothetical protein